MKRPSKAELLASAGNVVPDVIADELAVLFCGINPGLHTSFTGHHFAGPGNRFFPTLHASGFTPRQLKPAEKDELPALGLGITNVVSRATARADELTKEEFFAGGRTLVEKCERRRPTWLAVLGLGAYRTAFARPKAAVGPQPDHELGPTKIWVLPNPSGLNAHYKPADFARLFAQLREAAGLPDQKIT